MVAPYWCGLVTKCSATRLPTSWGESPAGQLVKYVASWASTLRFSVKINDAQRDATLSLSNRFISVFPRQFRGCHIAALVYRRRGLIDMRDQLAQRNWVW